MAEPLVTADVLKRFLDADGRLVSYPAKMKMRLAALSYLASKLEPGMQYTEKAINEALNAWNTFGDPATLRRELFNYKFIDRSSNGAAYWLCEQMPDLEP